MLLTLAQVCSIWGMAWADIKAGALTTATILSPSLLVKGLAGGMLDDGPLRPVDWDHCVM